ncbi:MAG: HK97 family phage prohead protease [Hyphomicrobiales bacterium]
METKIDLPILQRTAVMSPETANEDERTIDVVWSSGSRVRRKTWEGRSYDEELSLEPDHVNLDLLNAGAPVLDCHERWKISAVIGSVEMNSARVESGQGVATIRFSKRDDVAPIWEDVKAGHIRQVSVGYRVDAYEVKESENKRDLWRAVDWTPVEISAVPIGADPRAVFRSKTETETYPCVVRRDEKGIETMNDSLKIDIGADVAESEIRAQTDEAAIDEPVVEIAKAEPDEKRNDDELVAQTREAERDRVTTIFDLAAKLDLERDLASDLVKRGVALDEARKVILDKVAKRSDGDLFQRLDSAGRSR